MLSFPPSPPIKRENLSIFVEQQEVWQTKFVCDLLPQAPAPEPISQDVSISLQVSGLWPLFYVLYQV